MANIVFIYTVTNHSIILHIISYLNNADHKILTNALAHTVTREEAIITYNSIRLWSMARETNHYHSPIVRQTCTYVRTQHTIIEKRKKELTILIRVCIIKCVQQFRNRYTSSSA